MAFDFDHAHDEVLRTFDGSTHASSLYTPLSIPPAPAVLEDAGTAITFAHNTAEFIAHHLHRTRGAKAAGLIETGGHFGRISDDKHVEMVEKKREDTARQWLESLKSLISDQLFTFIAREKKIVEKQILEIDNILDQATDHIGRAGIDEPDAVKSLRNSRRDMARYQDDLDAMARDHQNARSLDDLNNIYARARQGADNFRQAASRASDYARDIWRTMPPAGAAFNANPGNYGSTPGHNTGAATGPSSPPPSSSDGTGKKKKGEEEKRKTTVHFPSPS